MPPARGCDWRSKPAGPAASGSGWSATGPTASGPCLLALRATRSWPRSWPSCAGWLRKSPACATSGDDPGALLARQSDLERQARERAWQASGVKDVPRRGPAHEPDRLVRCARGAGARRVCRYRWGIACRRGGRRPVPPPPRGCRRGRPPRARPRPAGPAPAGLRGSACRPGHRAPKPSWPGPSTASTGCSWPLSPAFLGSRPVVVVPTGRAARHPLGGAAHAGRPPGLRGPVGALWLGTTSRGQVTGGPAEQRRP